MGKDFISFRMKYILLSIYVFVIALCNAAIAQPGFEKGYWLGDSTSTFAKKVLQTSDGGYLLIGTNLVSNAISHVIVIKTTSTGDTVWTKIIRDSISTTRIYPNSVIELPNSQGYLIAGFSIVSTNYNNAFAFLLDLNGNLVWAKEFFHPTLAAEHFVGCSNSLDGNILLSGYANGSAIGITYLLMKITTAGTILWSRGIQNVLNNTMFNNISTIQLTDSSILICGSTQSYIVNNLQYVRNFIGKLSKDGTLLWAKTYGDSLTATEPSAISYDNNNRLIVSGRHTLITTGPQQTIGYLMSLDTAGNFLWYREYDTFINDIAGICNAKISATGQISALKRRYTSNGNEMQLFKTDTSGFPIWNKFIYSSSDTNLFAQDFVVTSDNGYAICGGYSVIKLKTQLIKADSSGSFNCSAIDTIITTTAHSIPSQNINPSVLIFAMNDSSKTYLSSSGFVVSDLCFETGIQEVNQFAGDFSFYPNPLNRTMNLTLRKKGRITIYNLQGQAITGKTMNKPGHYELDVSFLSPGIYIIKSGNTVRKFVKE